MELWQEMVYKKAKEKNFELKVSNIIGLIEKFSLKFEGFVKPIKENYKLININNSFCLSKEVDIYEGSFVPEFTIEETTLKIYVDFAEKLVTFATEMEDLLIVEIDSIRGAQVKKEGRGLLEQDLDNLLKVAFSNSIS